MELGDISSKLKALSIETGSVFKATMLRSDGVVPKHSGETSRDKYFVVLGKDDDSYLVGVLLINSGINNNLAKIIAPYQHCIYPDEYDFLDGQYRYVNCYDIKRISFKKISEEAEYIGFINDADMQEIIRLVRESPGNRHDILEQFNII